MRWLVTALFASALNAQDLADQIRSAQSSGRYAEAAGLYSQLITAGTDSPEIRSNYGVMLHLAGKNQEAMEQFRTALRANPGLAGANLFAGLTELDLNQPKLALPYLQKARDSDPSGPAPLLALGNSYVALRDYASANECYAKAAAIDPHQAEAWYGLGITDRSLAEQLLNRAARTGKKEQSADMKVHQLLNSAHEALRRAIDLDPDSPRAHLILAESLSDAGKPLEAVPEYQTAIKLDPLLDAAYLGLASQYWKQRQFDQALPPLRHVLAKSPRDPEANGILADILQHQNDNAGAKLHAQIALAGNPDLIETRIVLARVLLAEQQPKLAITQIQQVLAADPDGSYHFLLYRAYKQVGDDGAAKTALTAFQQFRSAARP